jgi:hypothetical protein
LDEKETSRYEFELFAPPAQVVSDCDTVSKARIFGGPERCDQNSLPKSSKQQIPRGLKAARDDKKKRLVTARLKLRPFKNR